MIYKLKRKEAQLYRGRRLTGIPTVKIYPWQKKKHHKRRIVQPEFVRLLASRLRPGGFFHMATDWENYAEHMLAVMAQAEGFSNTAREDYASDTGRPTTRFEQRGRRLGHGAWDLVYRQDSHGR